MVLMSPVGEAHVGIILVRLKVATKFIMRRKFRCIFGKFLNPLKISLLGNVFLIGLFLFLAELLMIYFWDVSIMGWKLVVSM